MTTYRLVVCIDVDAASLAEAYRRVREVMTSAPNGVAWETSDEWYSSDDADEPGDPEELQAAIMEVYRAAALSTVEACRRARDRPRVLLRGRDVSMSRALNWLTDYLVDASGNYYGPDDDSPPTKGEIPMTYSNRDAPSTECRGNSLQTHLIR